MTNKEKRDFERMIEEDWQRAANSPMPSRSEIERMEKMHRQQAQLGLWDVNCECPSYLLN